MIIAVKLIGKGTEDDPVRVNLPSYKWIEDLPGNRAQVEIPDDETDPNSRRVDKIKLRKKYSSQKWDRGDVGDDT